LPFSFFGFSLGFILSINLFLLLPLNFLEPLDVRVSSIHFLIVGFNGLVNSLDLFINFHESFLVCNRGHFNEQSLEFLLEVSIGLIQISNNLITVIHISLESEDSVFSLLHSLGFSLSGSGNLSCCCSLLLSYSLSSLISSKLSDLGIDLSNFSFKYSESLDHLIDSSLVDTVVTKECSHSVGWLTGSSGNSIGG
jgi:hypothetical protein